MQWWKSLLTGVLLIAPTLVLAQPASVEIPADLLDDKVRGGLLGQLLGNLNGLPHEMKYIDSPGAVETYTPALPDGARTDDDTDIEWVYVTEMHRRGQLILPPDVISDLWRRHINRGIWCSNAYARQLIDLGLEPPLTGRVALNPWSEFNISGSFLAETFGLVCPAMPRTAATTALNYTHVAIDAEPAQLTQFVAALIATAYVEDDVNRILDAGVAALDPSCALVAPIADARKWSAEQRDWRETRRLIKEKYQRHNGEMRDRNGYELNTASTVAALLYGKGDFRETMRLAFNFGWDADNNAATCGTVLGIVKGRRWMEAQGWTVKDVYRNTTRDEMPMDETITRFGDKLVALARLAILQEGGREVERNGRKLLVIPRQQPSNVEPLPRPIDRGEELRSKLRAQVKSELSRDDDTARARAAYVAVCIGDAERLSRERPDDWKRAIGLLKQRKDLIKAIRDAVPPTSLPIQRHFAAAGLIPPPRANND